MHIGQKGRVVLSWEWNPRYWAVSYHGGRESCCAMWLEFGPLEFGVGHGRDTQEKPR